MKKVFIGLVVLAICLTMLLPGFAACKSQPTPTQAVHWQIEVFTSQTAPIVTNYLPAFIDAVQDKTDGRFTIEVFDPGAVVPTTDISKAVAENVLQGGFTSPSFDVGIIPEANIITGLTFAFDDATQALDFYSNYEDGTASNLINDAYNTKGIQLISIECYDEPMAIMTMFPVSKVDDFKGKKIRATGSHAAGINALGAEQFYIPLGDVYTGLQTGMADGVFMATSGLETFKWKEIIKYVIEPYWMYGSPSILVANLDEWNKLPDEYKKILKETALEINRNITIPEVKKEAKEIEEAAKAAGVQWIILPPDEAAKYEQLSKDALWTQIEGQSPTNAELVGMVREYLK